MPRESQTGYNRRGHRPVESRDPRDEARPHDRDVQMDRRALYENMPSVTNRSFGDVGAGDGFGYAGQGGYGENLQMGGYAGVGPKDRWRADWRIEEDLHE